MNLENLHWLAMCDAQREEDERFERMKTTSQKSAAAPKRVLLYEITCNCPPIYWDSDTCCTRDPQQTIREAFEWWESKGKKWGCRPIPFFVVKPRRLTVKEINQMRSDNADL